MHPRNVWQALARPGFLLSPWPWRSAAYLATGAPAGAAALLCVAALTALGGALALVLVGLPLLVATALIGIPVAAVERRRLRLVDVAPAPDPHRPPVSVGLGAWLTTRLKEKATWRELGYALLFATALWPLDALALTGALLLPLSITATPLLLATVGDGRETKVLKLVTVTSWPAAVAVAVLGLVLTGVGAYALGAIAGGRAYLTRRLIASPEHELTVALAEVTRSRLRLVDAFEAERRRIERDLHDGAQQRLVALMMALGLARMDAPPGPFADRLAAAHEEAGAVLTELRELIRGIHPQVLTDYGLPAAIDDAADRSPVPVDVDVALPGRLPRAVESAAYFVVCEALVNIARHSNASIAEVSGEHRAGRLFLRVRDNGVGGADPAAGSGLAGLADRISVLDGRLTLSSPPGGPTLVDVELPCEPTNLCG
ncbi:sensor domain-containing protein [Streptomyces sp. NPDC048361]|uniref:sensor histidine kinase n=1 Tax=Streptomyces sp. NPDC048361 TaxID=3154720 RepID=UPI00341D15AF